MNPKIIKPIAIGGGVLLALIIVIALIVWAKNKIADTTTTIRLAADANKEIDTTKQTLTQTQLNTLASKLYTAMKGWGTDEDAIYAAFETLGSRTDLMQLRKTFGTKDGMTLDEWLADELNASEIEHLNNILATNSIDYKF